MLGSLAAGVSRRGDWWGEIHWLAGIGILDPMPRCVEGACD
jgi:hypothetical protein